MAKLQEREKRLRAKHLGHSLTLRVTQFNDLRFLNMKLEGVDLFLNLLVLLYFSDLASCTAPTVSLATH